MALIQYQQMLDVPFIPSLVFPRFFWPTWIPVFRLYHENTMGAMQCPKVVYPGKNGMAPQRGLVLGKSKCQLQIFFFTRKPKSPVMAKWKNLAPQRTKKNRFKITWPLTNNGVPPPPEIAAPLEKNFRAGFCLAGLPLGGNVFFMLRHYCVKALSPLRFGQMQTRRNCLGKNSDKIAKNKEKFGPANRNCIVFALEPVPTRLVPPWKIIIFAKAHPKALHGWGYMTLS